MQIDGATTSLFQSLVDYGPRRFTISGSGDDATGTSEAFGLDMTRRLEASAPVAEVETGKDESGDGQENGQRDASRLGTAMARAVEYIRGKFGDDTATAAMGILYQHAGEGQLSEERLGKGLLDVVRMVDRNHGFAAGDALMGQFNGELNNALNDYFDNGFEETFFALTPEVKQTMADVLASATAGSGLEEADVASLIDMLRQSLAEGGELTDETVRTMEQLATDPTAVTPERLGRLAAQALPEDSGVAAPSAYDMAAAAQYGSGRQAGMLLNAVV